jgi:hypothetical protein
MGLLVWLDLRGVDIVAFVLMDILGYLAGTMVPPGRWAIYTSILVSYHLFLGWLVFFGERKAAISFSTPVTIITHLACLTLIIPIGLVRHFFSFFGLLRFCIAAFAIFERNWLFSGNVVEHEPERVPEAPVAASTPEDFAEWSRYIAHRKPGSRAYGGSIKAEYEQWLRARHASAPTPDR